VLAVLVSTAVIAFLAAGCGGSKSAAPTKTEFVSKANAICAKADQKLEAAGQTFFEGTGDTQPTEADFVREKVVPILEQEVLDPFEALGAPKGDEEQVAAMIAAGREAIARLKQNALLLRAPPGSAKDPFRTVDRLNKAYGLTCGRDSQE
jgi:hypothetical protein